MDRKILDIVAKNLPKEKLNKINKAEAELNNFVNKGTNNLREYITNNFSKITKLIRNYEAVSQGVAYFPNSYEVVTNKIANISAGRL